MLGHQARIQQGVIERGVEDMPPGRIGTLDSGHAKLAVPGLPECIAGGTEIPRRQLGIEVGLGLRQADERGTDLRLDRLARGGVERDERAHIAALHLRPAGPLQHAFVHGGGRERLLEAHHEIALEVGQLQRPEIGVLAIRVVAADLVPTGVDFHIHITFDPGPGRLDQHAGLRSGRKRETQVATMVGGSDFGADPAPVAGIHADRVVIRRGNLVAARKRQLTRLRRVFRRIELGHQGDVAVVAHPDRRLVRPDEALDMPVGVVVGADADPILAGLCGPVGHAERRGHQRHGAAVFGTASSRADVGIDPIHRGARRCRGCGKRRGRAEEKEDACSQACTYRVASHRHASSQC